MLWGHPSPTACPTPRTFSPPPILLAPDCPHFAKNSGADSLSRSHRPSPHLQTHWLLCRGHDFMRMAHTPGPLTPAHHLWGDLLPPWPGSLASTADTSSAPDLHTGASQASSGHTLSLLPPAVLTPPTDSHRCCTTGPSTNHPPIHLSVRLSLHLSIACPATYPHINSPIHLSIHPSSHPATHPPICSSIHPSIHPPTHSLVHPSVHPPTCCVPGTVLGPGDTAVDTEGKKPPP